jgi:hypothetical protein
MATKEKEPLRQIKENEELELAKSAKIDGKSRKNNSSVRSADSSGNPLIR